MPSLSNQRTARIALAATAVILSACVTTGTDPNNPSLTSFQLLMGKAMNQLKYKRWKLSPKDTDLVKFYDAVLLAVVELLNYIKFNGLDPHTIYMSKHKIICLKV